MNIVFSLSIAWLILVAVVAAVAQVYHLNQTEAMQRFNPIKWHTFKTPVFFGVCALAISSSFIYG